MQTVFSVTLPFPSLRMMRRMARTVVRAMTGASLSQRTAASVVGPARVFSGEIFSLQRRNFHARSRPRSLLFPGEIRGLVASLRRFRKLRRRQTKKRISNDKREVELSVKVCVEECLSRNSEVLNIAELLRLNVAMVMKIAFDGLHDSAYRTRDNSICDVGNYERIELNVVLCDDDFIRKLNNDKAADVLSISRHIPNLDLPILILGDVVLSVENAARKAEERDHKLVDEIRILLVEGLLNLLGFDNSISDEAEREMARELELILGSLGWKKKNA